MSESRQITKAAGVVSAATFASRVLGYIRDMVIAWFFGAGMSADAFIAAFTVPNMLRRLFGEGTLSSAFIPVFSDILSRQGKNEALCMAQAAFRLVAVLLLAITVVGVFLSPQIVKLITPGFGSVPEKLALTIRLTKIMLPYVFFVGLVALCMGVLNGLDHFLAPALAPVMLNVAMIGAVLWLAPRFDQPVYGLAVGVLIGGGLQLLLQYPFLKQKGFAFDLSSPWRHPGLRRIGGLLFPVVFGAAVYQINILVDRFLASLLPGGSVSYLYYADRLVQFPLGLFGMAAATASLPSLSRQAARQDLAAFRRTVTESLRLVLFIIVPAMVGLVVLREPITVLLFQRGAFDATTSRLTAVAVLYYGMGLWAFASVRIVLVAYYALQDTRTPVVYAAIAVGFNIAAGIVLMRYLDHGGLALSTSLASVINLGLLLRTLRRKLGPMGWRALVAALVRIIICAGAMGLGVGILAGHLVGSYHDGTLVRLYGLGVSILSGILIYGICAFCTRSPELGNIIDFFRKPKGLQKT